MSPVWMVGSAGRTPFVGHFRGARVFGGVRLAWAGRVAATGTVEEGWAAAEQARDALSALIGAGDVDTVLSTAARALVGLDPRWLARRDLSVLFVASDGRGCRAVASGLASVHTLGAGVWSPVAEPGLLGEPGVPGGPSLPIVTAERWVAVPVGGAFPSGDVALACGVHP